MKPKRKSVLPKVKVYLLQGYTLTQRQCVEKWEGWRLADVVYKLKKYGLKIQKKMIRDKKRGVSYAMYFIPKRATV